MSGLRASRAALQLLDGRAGFAAQQSSWWQGTASPAAAAAAALGWQRVTALIPSLADMQLLAAPKKKVRATEPGYVRVHDVANRGMRLAWIISAAGRRKAASVRLGHPRLPLGSILLCSCWLCQCLSCMRPHISS